MIVIFTIIFLITLCKSLFPNEPTLFGTRIGIATPNISYTFRQTDCLNSITQEDINQVLSLYRNTTSTSCPNRTSAYGSFSDAAIGIKISDPTQRDALESKAINNAFSMFTTPSVTTGYQYMSIEMWLTPTGIFSGSTSYSLLEIGGLTGFNYSPGITEDSVQFQFSFQTPFEIDIVYTGNFLDNFDNVYLNETTLLAITICPAAFKTIFSQFVSSSYSNQKFYFVMTVDGSTQQLNVFIGKNTSFQSCGFRTSFYINNFLFNSDSVLRIGTTKATPLGPSYSGFPGEINFVAIYNQVLTPSQILSLFQTGLPNSLPVPTSVTYFEIYENSINNVMNLSNVKYFDADGNTVSYYIIKTVPLDGNFLYNNITVTPGTIITNPLLLTYKQGIEYKFTCLASNINISCTYPYENFTFTISDGICDNSLTARNNSNCNSPTIGTGIITIREIYNPPYSTNGNLNLNVINGTSLTIFELLVSSNNDLYTDGNGSISSYAVHSNLSDEHSYISGVNVYFNQTIGTYGKLVSMINETTCNTTTILLNNTGISYGIYTSSIKKFLFCYVPLSNSSNNVIPGSIDEFGFQFSSRSTTTTKGPLSTISFITPTTSPTLTPTLVPTITPTLVPTLTPTLVPTQIPTTLLPTILPTITPTILPTLKPTFFPGLQPTIMPSTLQPTTLPTIEPTLQPTILPTIGPTLLPSTLSPTTLLPSIQPTIHPTLFPGLQPTILPTTLLPTILPTTLLPSNQPTLLPTKKPTVTSTFIPTFTLIPTVKPRTNDGFNPLNSSLSLIFMFFLLIINLF